MQQQATIIKVSGPLVVASGMNSARMYEVVRVSEKKLVGEVIQIEGGTASIQVYEETTGIGPGEPVYLTGMTMSAELGPGLLENMFDGIQRPLSAIERESGHFIGRGIDVPALDRTRKWQFSPKKQVGDFVKEGDILGEIPETTLITHRIMTPPGVSGKIASIEIGEFTVEEAVATIETEGGGVETVTLMTRWPIRRARPIARKFVPSKPLLSGVRVLDVFFPVAKGGAACSPGPFGSGKTVTQQSLAKYSDAEVIVYVGCGERGNEMTDVLAEFPELKDPNTGEPLMKRTIMVANTSNMPVAAREASVYTGITIAEYYRDMGYHVALMADSTSRWAEAMREISGRLEEMPGEEGYPAYLGSRTAAFYERAGYVSCLGSDDREGSLTVIGAVSPPGGDLSEPVTQNTFRVTKVFWGLDASLAKKRHYPAINWLSSYTLYMENIAEYLNNLAGSDFTALREEALAILQEEARLEEIVRLVGVDALSMRERLLLETARSIREDFLFQNAFDPEDAYTPISRQYLMLKSILALYTRMKPIVEDEDFEFSRYLDLVVRSEFAGLSKKTEDELASLLARIETETNELTHAPAAISSAS